MRDTIKTIRSAQQSIHTMDANAFRVWRDSTSFAFRDRYYKPIVDILSRFIHAAEDLETAIEEAECLI